MSIFECQSCKNEHDDELLRWSTVLGQEICEDCWSTDSALENTCVFEEDGIARPAGVPLSRPLPLASARTKTWGKLRLALFLSVRLSHEGFRA